MLSDVKKVDLITAAGHIKQVCDENRTMDEPAPFFFLVGSGISYPPVPLASKIEETCKVVSREHKRIEPPPGARLIDTYSHWFDQAYPHAVERQRYLRGLIEGKFISHANFRLAHLLLEKSIANLVVTTNFDDFLSRALSLFGKAHIVCDHPRTVERINPEAEDIQIVHVHGTYWFYDCCNLKGEIEERSRGSAENSLTMASLLDTLMARRSPLVIGYGGWEGDVVMCALRRRLQNLLPYNLYWFCYRESEAESLPDFIRNHPNVYFVIGTRPPALTAAVAGGPVEGSYTAEEPQLPAQKVLDELIRVFNLPAPALTQDPLGYFADYLKQSLPQEDGTTAQTDIYSLASVIERIEAARGQTIKARASRMEQIRDRLRRSQYREAIRLGVEMAAGKLAARESRDLLSAMLTAAWRLDDSSAEEIQGYDLTIRLGDSTPKADGYVRERVAMAMVNKGLALAGGNAQKEAVAVFDEVIKRFGKDREPFFRQQVAEAMFNRAYTLDAMGRRDAAIDAYDQVVQRLNKAEEPELQEMLAMALLNKGYTLGELQRGREEQQAYSDLVKRFSATKDPDIQMLVAQAMYNKGLSLQGQNHGKAAAKAFQTVIDRFELSRNRELRALVDSARAGLQETDSPASPEAAEPEAR